MTRTTPPPPPGCEARWGEALTRGRHARRIVALTGAGISVESGIPDFRSPGGIWTRFPAEEYATLQAFHRDPARSWELFRALYGDVGGKEPNAAHRALARLEAGGRLAGVITQNIDGLHQAAGSRTVVEMHGDCRRLHCPGCGWRGPAAVEALMAATGHPTCPMCREAVKPNVVLFGEEIQYGPALGELLAGADLVLVVGTSASVYPANLLPLQVADAGGAILEFNLEATALTRGELPGGGRSDLLLQGRATRTLPPFADALLQ